VCSDYSLVTFDFLDDLLCFLFFVLVSKSGKLLAKACSIDDPVYCTKLKVNIILTQFLRNLPYLAFSLKAFLEYPQLSFDPFLLFLFYKSIVYNKL